MSQNNFVIYKFTSPSGKSYIGQTCNLDGRIKAHKNSDSCRAFHTAIKKYGFENFTLEILHENLTIENANSLEPICINSHNTMYPNGYNLRTGGDSSIPSNESRAKMSASKIGIKKPDNAEKTRAFHTGRKRTAESCLRISIAKKGNVCSPETRKKISDTKTGVKRVGYSHTDEFKENLSTRLKGVPKSAEHRAKMSEAAKKRAPISEETREKLRKSTSERHAKNREEKAALMLSKAAF